MSSTVSTAERADHWVVHPEGRAGAEIAARTSPLPGAEPLTVVTGAALAGEPYATTQVTGLDAVAAGPGAVAVVDGVTPVGEPPPYGMREWVSDAVHALVASAHEPRPLEVAAHRLARLRCGHATASAAAATATMDAATRTVIVRIVADAAAWADWGDGWHLLPSGRDPTAAIRGPLPRDHVLERFRALRAARGADTAWAHIRDELAHARVSDGGRSARVLADDPTVAVNASTYTLDAPRRVLLATDGVAAAAVGLGLVDGAADVPMIVEPHDPAAVLHRLVDAQRADAGGARWPRVHHVEDAAVALLSLHGWHRDERPRRGR